MKDLIVAVALLTICAAPTRAGAQEQAPVPPPKGGQAQADQALERLEQFKERLKLTPEQIERVRPVLIEEAQKLKALREKADGSGQEPARASQAGARAARDPGPDRRPIEEGALEGTDERAEEDPRGAPRAAARSRWPSITHTREEYTSCAHITSPHLPCCCSARHC